MVFERTIVEEFRHPEKELIGNWDEVDWQFDKVDKLKGSSAILKGNLKFDIKNQISNGLIIHEAEQWNFQKGGRLILTKKNKEKEIVEWHLKGRGHILKIKHTSGIIEYYQIYNLNRDNLILHFENDNHARGIIKISLKKIFKIDAKKI